MSELRDEFPKYAVLTAEVSSDYSSLNFWKDHETSMPKWSEAAKNAFLLQPSSAAAERVFSVLNNSFGKKQLGSLEDYIETSENTTIQQKSKLVKYKLVTTCIVLNFVFCVVHFFAVQKNNWSIFSE